MAIDPNQMMGGAPPPGGAPGAPLGGVPGTPPMDPMALMMALKSLKKAAPRHHPKAKAKGKKTK